MMDEFFKCKDMVEVLANSAGRALGGVIAKFKSISDMGVNTYTKLFHSCVVPVIDYCAGVWGLTNNTKAESVQHRALRYFLGVHKYAPNLAIEGDMGWETCKVRWGVDIVRLWNRLVNMNCDRLTKRVFDWDYGVNVNNWSSGVALLFGNTNLLNNFSDKTTCNIDVFRKRLMDLEREKWQKSLPNKPKLRTYITFKDTYEQENYLKINLSRTERSYLAQFRCGILPIRIETGRFRGEAVGERICTLCESGNVEDELHFVLHCGKYADLREALFNDVNMLEKNFGTLSDPNKLCVLITKFPRKIAKFIKNAFNRRRKTLIV